MIDRYTFLDLLPCSVAELKSIGYIDTSASATASVPQSKSFNSAASSTAPQSNAELLYAAAVAKKKAKFPSPDEMQMLPFKPVRNAG